MKKILFFVIAISILFFGTKYVFGTQWVNSKVNLASTGQLGLNFSAEIRAYQSDGRPSIKKESVGGVNYFKFKQEITVESKANGQLTVALPIIEKWTLSAYAATPVYVPVTLPQSAKVSIFDKNEKTELSNSGTIAIQKNTRTKYLVVLTIPAADMASGIYDGTLSTYTFTTTQENRFSFLKHNRRDSNSQSTNGVTFINGAPSITGVAVRGQTGATSILVTGANLVGDVYINDKKVNRTQVYLNETSLEIPIGNGDKNKIDLYSGEGSNGLPWGSIVLTPATHSIYIKNKEGKSNVMQFSFTQQEAEKNKGGSGLAVTVSPRGFYNEAMYARLFGLSSKSELATYLTTHGYRAYSLSWRGADPTLGIDCQFVIATTFRDRPAYPNGYVRATDTNGVLGAQILKGEQLVDATSQEFKNNSIGKESGNLSFILKTSSLKSSPNRESVTVECSSNGYQPPAASYGVWNNANL